MDRIYVTNGKKYNHYTDRKPPWVKLHRGILDSTTYAKLADRQWRLGLELILLCSEEPDGVIDLDVTVMTWRLRRRIDVRDVVALISAGFLTVLHDASRVLAGCKQIGASETETETETEERQRQNTAALSAAKGVRVKLDTLPAKPEKPAVRFEEWWIVYRECLKACERKVSYKADAKEVWRSRGMDAEADGIIERTKQQLAWFKDAVRSGKRPEKFPDPQRWLSKSRFNDEVPT